MVVGACERGYYYHGIAVGDVGEADGVDFARLAADGAQQDAGLACQVGADFAGGQLVGGYMGFGDPRDQPHRGRCEWLVGGFAVGGGVSSVMVFSLKLAEGGGVDCLIFRVYGLRADGHGDWLGWRTGKSGGRGSGWGGGNGMDGQRTQTQRPEDGVVLELVIWGDSEAGDFFAEDFQSDAGF